MVSWCHFILYATLQACLHVHSRRTDATCARANLTSIGTAETNFDGILRSRGTIVPYLSSALEVHSETSGWGANIAAGLKWLDDTIIEVFGQANAAVGFVQSLTIDTGLATAVEALVGQAFGAVAPTVAFSAALRDIYHFARDFAAWWESPKEPCKCLRYIAVANLLNTLLSAISNSLATVADTSVRAIVLAIGPLGSHAVAMAGTLSILGRVGGAISWVLDKLVLTVIQSVCETWTCCEKADPQQEEEKIHANTEAAKTDQDISNARKEFESQSQKIREDSEAAYNEMRIKWFELFPDSPTLNQFSHVGGSQLDGFDRYDPAAKQLAMDPENKRVKADFSDEKVMRFDDEAKAQIVKAFPTKFSPAELEEVESEDFNAYVLSKVSGSDIREACLAAGAHEKMLTPEIAVDTNTLASVNLRLLFQLLRGDANIMKKAEDLKAKDFNEVFAVLPKLHPSVTEGHENLRGSVEVAEHTQVRS